MPLAADGCRIDFLLRYDFKSVITRKLAGPVFDHIANTLVDAFVARADRIYGGPAVPVPASFAIAPSAPPAPGADPLNAAAPAALGREPQPE
jgi:hypothetical protein